MAQGLQNLNFTQSRDRHALFLIVHEDTLQSDRVALFAMNGFVHFSIGIVSSEATLSHEESCQKDDNAPESTLTELAQQLVIGDSRASNKAIPRSLMLDRECAR